MRKRFVLGFAICAVLGGVIGYAADEGSPVDRYKQERTAKRAYERFLSAKEMLETSPDAGVIGEAVAMLEKLNIELSETPEHREYKHLPLYKASILFKEGKNYPAAEEAFTEFMNRNAGKNQKIIASALRLARDLEIREDDKKKVDEFATYLIDTEWFQDETVRKDFSEDDIASLYDLQMMGLAWSGKFDESAKICQYVFNNYPKTLAAATCLRYYASYIGWHDNNEEEAILIYTDLIDHSPHDSAKIGAYCALSRIAFKRRPGKKSDLDFCRISILSSAV